MTDADLTLRDEVAEVLREVPIGPFGPNARETINAGGTTFLNGSEREAMTDALLPLLARLREEERARAKFNDEVRREQLRMTEVRALREFVAWVATSRAFNGSSHRHGQSLYNECLNAVLPEWAERWLSDRADRIGGDA